MAAWSVCFNTARRERAGNLLLEKSLIPSYYVEIKMLEAVRGEGDLPACLILLNVFLTQPPRPPISPFVQGRSYPCWSDGSCCNLFNQNPVISQTTWDFETAGCCLYD